MSGHGSGHIDPAHKKIALLIAILALFLALSETLGKSAQTSALSYNIEASNLWASPRPGRSAGPRCARPRSRRGGAAARKSSAKREILQKRIDEWRKVAATYDSEPEKQEGRKELAQRAKVAESSRERAMAAYHHYEIASACLQIAIVLASANIITGVAALLWLSGGLGVVAIGFSLIGFFAPLSVHLF